jgi:hypothetical protein
MRREFTADEKHREALREVEMRVTVYEHKITMGTMSRREADRRIALMREIAADYAALAEKERLL